MEIDWTKKMQPKPSRVKIVEPADTPTSGTMFFANRRELYEVLGAPRSDERKQK